MEKNTKWNENQGPRNTIPAKPLQPTHSYLSHPEVLDRYTRMPQNQEIPSDTDSSQASNSKHQMEYTTVWLAHHISENSKIRIEQSYWGLAQSQL